MDDVDAVQAQIARNMLTSGDWVTARLDGVVYLEKAPLIYWMIAASYKVFGVHDWAARIPILARCLHPGGLFGSRLLLASGLLAKTGRILCRPPAPHITCVGLFLFPPEF